MFQLLKWKPKANIQALLIFVLHLLQTATVCSWILLLISKYSFFDNIQFFISVSDRFIKYEYVAMWRDEYWGSFLYHFSFASYVNASPKCESEHILAFEV